MPFPGKGAIWSRWWWTRRLGRRGASLLFFGLLSAFITFSLVVEPPPALDNLGLLFPRTVWIVLWMTSTILCFVCAWLSVPHDAVAYASSIAVKALWGSAYMFYWYTHDVPRGWVAATIWWGFAIHVAIVAGWPEPVYAHDDTHPEEETPER